MRRSALLLVLALVATLAPATALPAAAATPTPAASIAWQPCPEDAEVECGTLTVPIDWNAPSGATFQVALARRKATDPAARTGSLLINPGGPGGSGVNAVILGRDAFSPEITRRFDVVGFDPRGVARSHPVVCSADLLSRNPDPLMKSQADFDRRLAYNQQLRADCKARTGPLFDHVDTLSVVRDLDAIRAALGEDKLTYYGVSYGTLIGQLYAERFPHRVRALALDSNMDHSLGTRGFLDTEAWAAEDSFDEFADWCARTDSCVLHDRNVRAFWADLLARADRGELRMPGQPDVPLDRLTLTFVAFGAFYGPDWAALADFLVAVDTGAPAPAGLRVTPPAKGQEVYPNPIQVLCEDYLLPMRDYREFAAHLKRSAKIAPDMRISPLAISATVACLGQPAPIPNPQHRLRYDGRVKLLLGNALHDPATGYLWAVSTALQIGREGVLLTYEGWGHGIYGRSDCTTGAVDRYLLSQALPARGARCPAVPPAEVSVRRGLPTPSGPLPGLPGWTLHL